MIQWDDGSTEGSSHRLMVQVYLDRLFTTYQNKHWTIRQRDDHSINPSSHHIILKIVGFYTPHIKLNL